MNKRSATSIAATLVGVLVIGGLAFSMGLTGPTASAATGRTPTAQKPIVRTRTRTIVVHRQAPAGTPTVVRVSSSNSGPSDASGPSTSSGPGREGSDDDQEQNEQDGQELNQQDGQDDHGGNDDLGDDRA
jgi:hypothetical protein